ncbi:hypothetical protein BH20ACT15_BH20ACT15_10120 [soil metagenome]
MAAPPSSSSPSSGSSRARAAGTSTCAAPERERRGRGAYSQAEVDRFDEELDRGAQELVEGLRAMTRANMEDEADTLADALAPDSILPEDF